MPQVKITCPKCKETTIVSYHTNMGHDAIDEAGAIDRAIKRHKCRAKFPDQQRQVAAKGV